MSLLGNIRDRVVESVIRKNETVQRFGSIQDVFIDSESRIANVKILLRGESQDTLFRAYYSFEDGDKGTELVFDKLTCDRTWINEALKMFMDGRRLNFPIADYSGEAFAGITGKFAKILF
ncbi:MAG: hypothetical protein IK012_09380 [Fibrobacter sp.]|uniref:hypothetical protein n=1 Tax=Fibrobacter sp. TaxID=35828 RepID=UPI0025B8AA1A|nr:hypothetical protein [Fibrobacter sp.]MBR4785444.1 hypothetical protein [Fibrobacter sp.]